MSRHYITIRTGGVIQDKQDVFRHRGTLAHLVLVIQNEIDDITDEYVHSIQESIFAAIRFCERESFYFNESRDVVFMTQAGKGGYDATDAAHIETAVKIKNVFLVNDNRKSELKQRNHLSLESSLHSGQQGTPVCYSYFDRKLYLYPIPDASYQIQLILSPMRLEELENAHQEHPWFVHTFDLIKARAKYGLYKNILKEADCAAAAYNDFTEQFPEFNALIYKDNLVLFILN